MGRLELHFNGGKMYVAHDVDLEPYILHAVNDMPVTHYPERGDVSQWSVARCELRRGLDGVSLLMELRSQNKGVS